MWIFGLLMLAAGVNGLIPIASYATWQMPLWMSVTLIIVGAIVLVISPSENAPTAKRAQRPPQAH
jgi:hypothetical protein